MPTGLPSSHRSTWYTVATALRQASAPCVACATFVGTGSAEYCADSALYKTKNLLLTTVGKSSQTWRDMEKMSPPAARPSSALMPRRGPLGFVLLLMLVLAICTASAQPSVHPRVDESGVALRRFIIGYKEGRGPTGSRAGYRGNARFLSRDTEVELLELPDYLTADEVDAVQNEIHLDDSVEYVELDRAVFLGSSSASDEDFSSDDDSYRRPLYDSERMWGLVRAGAPGAWNAAFTGDTGSETVVCIIDTGCGSVRASYDTAASAHLCYRVVQTSVLDQITCNLRVFVRSCALLFPLPLPGAY